MFFASAIDITRLVIMFMVAYVMSPIIYPFSLIFEFSQSLPNIIWFNLSMFSILISALMVYKFKWRSMLSILFGVIIFSFSVILILDGIKLKTLLEKEPDRYEFNSTLQSVFYARNEFQHFLHAAYLKDCQAYAWSYKEMNFYRLSSSVVHNVVRRDWLEICPSLKLTPR